MGENRFLYRGIKYNIFGLIPKTSYVTQTLSFKYRVVRDSCRLNGIDNLAVAVQRQRVIHTENNGFASPTLGQHISTFRGYRILFSIINLI